MSYARAAAAHFANARRVLSSETRADAMTDVIARLERDDARHLKGFRPTEEEIRRLEASLGRRLPSDFRRLTGRFGGSILYDGHELFGPRPLFIHDIVMVPDLLSVRASLQRDGGLAPHLLPFHRASDTVHALDLSAANGETAPVVAVGGGTRHPSLAAFLAEVVRPRAPESP